MKREKLKVEKRSVLGKKVKKLRREGFLPANIYGRDVKSLAVQVAYKDFDPVFKEAGETGLVDLQLDSEVRPVLIHNVQYDHVSHKPVHADFYQVNLKEKVKTMVPLEIVGEPKAVTEKVGILLQTMNEIEVEALPTELPENVEVNVENLANIDDHILVSDLKIPQGVEILTDPNQTVAKIGELVSKETEELAEQMEAEAEAAQEATEVGQATEEGEKAPESEAEAGDKGETEEAKETTKEDGDKKEEPAENS